MSSELATMIAEMSPAGRAVYEQIRGLVRDGLLYRVDAAVEAIRPFCPPENLEKCRAAMVEAIKRDPVVN